MSAARSDYRVVRYEPSLREALIGLERMLWSPDPAVCASYLDWKYHENPYASEVHIYLAMRGADAVAARGMYGSRWEYGRPARRLDALCRADTVIHPNHRGRGIVRWFIKLARAAIDDDLGEELAWYRAILTADGTRVHPIPAAASGQLLVKRLPGNSLAGEVGIGPTIHEHYLSRWTDSVAVRKWLGEKRVLEDTPTVESTLRALAARSGREEPIALSDKGLRMLRDALVEVDTAVREALGPRIGEAVALDVRLWKGSKREVESRPPSDAYLPATIDDRTDGWGKVAGRTPGLVWIHPRYAEVLRRPGRARTGSRSAHLAAKALMQLLGAETAPRLVAPTSVQTMYREEVSVIEWREMLPSQREALGGRYASHFKDDYLSPDLTRVISNLEKERSRKARRERASALVATLDREWARLYEGRTTAEAVRPNGRWRHVAFVPATWVAVARDHAWMPAENGVRHEPPELMIRTRVTTAIYGDDRDLFASALASGAQVSPSVSAFGVQQDPRVSELVDHIADYRREGGTDARFTSLRYRAISESITKREPALDDPVGDLTVRKLHARFGGNGRTPGLLLVDGRWYRPQEVFSGSPVLGERRPFLSWEEGLARLWKALRVGPPSIGDCVTVLDEIAGGPGEDGDESTLISIYHYLDRLLPEATASEKAQLGSLPLWTNGTWTTARPVYVLEDQLAAAEFAKHFPVWQPPVNPASMPNLIDATGVTHLTDSHLVPSVHKGAFEAAEPHRRRFTDAVGLLREWLARHDRALDDVRSVSWADIEQARLAVDKDLVLEFRPERTPATVAVPAAAHVTRDPLTFYFSSWDAAGSDLHGGRAVSTLFPEGDRDKLALAWAKCFADAQHGKTATVALPDDAALEEALGDIFDQATSAVATRRGQRRATTAKPPKTGSGDSEGAPLRRLKPIEALVPTGVDRVASDALPDVASTQRAGLHSELPDATTIDRRKRAPRSAPRDYSDEDRETMGIQLVDAAIRGGAGGLADYRHFRGVGADAIDRSGKAYELKAYAGDLPNTITLTANEVELAVRKGLDFMLAVVAGLEEGYETQVRLIPDPLRNLSLKANASLTLEGIREVSSVVVTFTEGHDADKRGAG